MSGRYVTDKNLDSCEIAPPTPPGDVEIYGADGTVLVTMHLDENPVRTEIHHPDRLDEAAHRFLAAIREIAGGEG